jgi:hypothetical protein
MRLLLASLLFAGCAASVTATPVNAPPTRMVRRAPADVEIFTAGAPTRPHPDVAILEAEPGFSERSTADLVARMRENAAANGCDGLVITGVDTQTFRHGDEKKTVTGTCIVWSAPAVAQP